MDTGKKGVCDDKSISSEYTKGGDVDDQSFHWPKIVGTTSREPIRVGDIISYWSTIFPAGDSRGYRETAVTKIEPEKDNPLTLANSEVILKDHQVTRVQIMVDGNLVQHDGLSRCIEEFKMKQNGHGTACAGVEQDTAIFGDIVAKGKAKLQHRQFGLRGDESYVETPQSEKDFYNRISASSKATAKKLANVQRLLDSDFASAAPDTSDDDSVLSNSNVKDSIEGLSKLSQSTSGGMFGFHFSLRKMCK